MKEWQYWRASRVHCVAEGAWYGEDDHRESSYRFNEVESKATPYPREVALGRHKLEVAIATFALSSARSSKGVVSTPM